MKTDAPEDPVDAYEPVLDNLMEPSEEVIVRAIRRLKNNNTTRTDTMLA